MELLNSNWTRTSIQNVLAFLVDRWVDRSNIPMLCPSKPLNVTTIHACCECFRNAHNCSRVARATIQGCLRLQDSGWHFGYKMRHSQIFTSYHRVYLWWHVSLIHASRCLWLKLLYCIRLCYVSLYNLDMHTVTHFSLNVKLLCAETQHGSSSVL